MADPQWMFYSDGVYGPAEEQELRDFGKSLGIFSDGKGIASVVMEQMWAEIDRLRAALSPSPPAPGGVPIRIAVAFDDDGNHDAYRIRAEESFAWEVLNRRGYELRAAIITATVAPPVVAEIAGIVEQL